jgi:hypothetical protein
MNPPAWLFLGHLTAMLAPRAIVTAGVLLADNGASHGPKQLGPLQPEFVCFWLVLVWGSVT